jgi:uncharacterized protein
MTLYAGKRYMLEELPKTIPVFPLTGVLLLPRGRLPLNIFEPRYLAMTEDALATQHRLIGMIQPTEPEKNAPPKLFPTGCAGRIISFSETEDGRYLITLAGLCRFSIVEEVETVRGYRRVVADFTRWQPDLQADSTAGVDRQRLLDLLKAYFANASISADWEAIGKTPDDRLVTMLAMICPFEPQEKQALLEAPTLAERCKLMSALMEMAILSRGGPEAAKH